MNHECSTAISRRNGEVRNGTRKVLLLRRKYAWADPGWKPWLLFLSTAVALCTKNLYLQDTVNHAFYKDVLERLQKWVQWVRRDIADDWVLQHDNAPAHTALSIQEFLAKKNIPVLPQPLYSPDLAPCDFYLFLNWNRSWRVIISGRWKTQKIVTDERNTLTENDFQYCYDQWEKRWNHCVTSQGSYFEGDNL